MIVFNHHQRWQNENQCLFYVSTWYKLTEALKNNESVINLNFILETILFIIVEINKTFNPILAGQKLCMGYYSHSAKLWACLITFYVCF